MMNAPRAAPRRRRALLSALLLLLCPPAAVAAETLAELLATVADSARFPIPARADGRVTCEPACRAARVILFGRGDTLYVEVQAGLRALVRPSDVVVADGAAPAPAKGRALGDTTILLEDLRVFVPASLSVPQISDDGPDGVVVTAAPASPSPYSLLVVTVDRERRRIVKTQYYRDSISNLVKMRRDTAWTQVGGHWRPGEIAVESLRDGKTTKLVLDWREVADAPAALFEPTGLAGPSGLTWP